MRDNIFYQGENIPLSISSAEGFSGCDFIVMVYHIYDRNKMIIRRKSDFVEEEIDGKRMLSAVLPHEETLSLPAGEYAVEIMIEEDDGYRSIYQDLHAFKLKFSNIKNIVS